jgi:circadian clock protein KaiC
VTIFDPVTNLLQAAGGTDEVNAMLTRLIDFLKSQQITAMFTSLTTGDQARESTDVGISSLMDTWLLVRDIELNGERNRALYILKSRGMNHSNQVREFIITSKGIDLIDVYLGRAGMLTGSARLNQEALERTEAKERSQASRKRIREIERRRKTLEAQIAALRAEYESEAEEARRILNEDGKRSETLEKERQAMAKKRFADVVQPTSVNGGRA